MHPYGYIFLNVFLGVLLSALLAVPLWVFLEVKQQARASLGDV